MCVYYDPHFSIIMLVAIINLLQQNIMDAPNIKLNDVDETNEICRGLLLDAERGKAIRSNEN